MDNVVTLVGTSKLRVEDLQLLLEYNLTRQTLLKDIDLVRLTQLDEECTELVKELRSAMLKG
ncbi:hypothetical protein D3C86_1376740 [compost metagenome]